MKTSLILLMLLFVAAGCGGTEESSTNPTSLASPVSTTVSSAATLTPTPAPPVPTSAPEPDRTPTSVPIPTDTPDPTPVDTSAPTPTNTPVPEGTPEPTPLPTQTPLPPPGVVVDLEIANVTENSITLQWKPPDNSNVVPIEHYEVTRDIAFRPDEHHAVAETTFIDTELESSTEHRYRVRAIGPGGIEGAEISIVGSTLDSATPAPNRTPIPEPTPTDTPQPTATRTSLPTATATLTPEPTSTPTSEPTQTPTPEPTPTVTPQPSATPKPIAPTQIPIPTAMPAPTAPPTIEPIVEPTLTPTVEEALQAFLLCERLRLNEEVYWGISPSTLQNLDPRFSGTLEPGDYIRILTPESKNGAIRVKVYTHDLRSVNSESKDQVWIDWDILVLQPEYRLDQLVFACED